MPLHDVYPDSGDSTGETRAVVALLPTLAEDWMPAAPSVPPRAIRSSCVSPEQALLQLAGHEPCALGELPGALCRYSADTGRTAPSALVCADPVHLLADRDTARLGDGAALALSRSDAQRLCDAANELLQADGLHLHCPTPDRWYLEGLEPGALDTAPTSYVSGRSLNAFLPAQENAANWRTLMSEMQMLLHAHPVNAERQQQGLPAINGLWFWGGAALPARVHTPELTVFSDDPFARGLCALTGVECRPLSGFGADDAVSATVASRSAGSALYVLLDSQMSRQTARTLLDSLQSLYEAGQFSRVIIDRGDHAALDLARLRQGIWGRLKARLWRW